MRAAHQFTTIYLMHWYFIFYGILTAWPNGTKHFVPSELTLFLNISAIMLNIATWFVSEYFMRFYIGFVVGWYHWTEFSLPNSQIVCDRKMYKCAASNPWNAWLYFRFYCDGAEPSWAKPERKSAYGKGERPANRSKWCVEIHRERE